eukprot:CAMPEP_0198293248 /NCGR_PEP_ID=MMETSP1449-20131203/16178_1 /TAXON_ID=420275 /ORGANISM="Attheya septentrionalis, Strain CCMP2084" /LENGTH=284 /DNA_ID=CAMNT_0043992763 /DNA_START=227 /DNA_END=1081 /DNA_ORIENTATION=+
MVQVYSRTLKDRNRSKQNFPLIRKAIQLCTLVVVSYGVIFVVFSVPRSFSPIQPFALRIATENKAQLGYLRKEPNALNQSYVDVSNSLGNAVNEGKGKMLHGRLDPVVFASKCGNRSSTACKEIGGYILDISVAEYDDAEDDDYDDDGGNDDYYDYEIDEANDHYWKKTKGQGVIEENQIFVKKAKPEFWGPADDEDIDKGHSEDVDNVNIDDEDSEDVDNVNIDEGDSEDVDNMNVDKGDSEDVDNMDVDEGDAQEVDDEIDEEEEIAQYWGPSEDIKPTKKT